MTSPRTAESAARQPSAASTHYVVFDFLFMAVLPLAGLIAELECGFATEALGLYPNAVVLGAVLASLVLNIALRLPPVAGLLPPVAHATVFGFVLGMAVLYSVVLGPLVPLMIFGAIFLVGLLAWAPYLVLCGQPRIWREVRAKAADVGWPAGRAGRHVLVVAALTMAAVCYAAFPRNQDRAPIDRLALAMRKGTAGEAAAEALAAEVRQGDIEKQRKWLDSVVYEDTEEFGLLGRRSRQLFSHSTFWFLREKKVSQDERHAAFHRAHGFGPTESRGRASSGGLGPWWKKSEWTITAEPRAAVARLDWELVAEGRNSFLDTAWFELQLPPGAVASSLSSWIDGEERPAAFASDGRAKKAFDSVVARRLDPVLLREVGPRRLWMQLFPLAAGLPPMRVRVGITVPLRRNGDALVLSLPELVDHTCTPLVGDLHTLRVVRADGSVDERTVEGKDLSQAVPIAGGFVRVACARDAEGFVVQTLAPSEQAAAPRAPQPLVVVFDASHSTAAARDDLVALVQSLPRGRRLLLYAAHGSALQRHEALAGDDTLVAWLRSQSFDGGTDPRPALAAATAEAARLGSTEVLWFHGGSVHLLPGHDPAWAKDVQVYAVPLSRSPQQLYQLEAFRSQLVTAPMRPLAAAQRWLQQFVNVDAANVPTDGFVRTFARASTPPADAVVVDDQLVRLWAASEARDRQRRGEATATGLAASYRVVTAGASAVVLERREQYDEHKLEPGAISGREPPELLGGRPVPEPATWLLLGSGLAVIAWRQRRRSLAARAPSV